MTEQPTTPLADELEGTFGDRSIDGLWCNVPAKTMRRIIAALRNQQAPSPEGVEPDAMRYGFDGYGYQYIDSGAPVRLPSRQSDRLFDVRGDAGGAGAD
jgi:hypothetical protein